MKIHVGKRILKTALAVYVCFLIYMLRSEQGFPFFSTVTAILCMQPYVGNTAKVAGNQLLGTLVGASYGLLILCLFKYGFPDANVYVIVFVVSLFIIPVIETAVLIGKAEMSHFMCVVFLCMAVYLFQEGDPFLYVMDRTMDTIIGVVVAWVINSFNIPRKRRTDLLFVSAFDHKQRSKNNKLSSFSKIELNKMIEDGANFTVSTEQTPASLIEYFAGIDLNLPVICMNGAVLYDISKNKYLHKMPIDRKVVEQIDRILEEEGAGCFYNSLIQDTLLIYFEDFKNIVMQEVYRDLRKNPYRNYVCGRLPENVKILYLYIVDETAKIENIVKRIQESELNDKVRLVKGEEAKYKDHSYLKIYDHESTRQNMIAYLRQIIGAEASITFGSKEGKCDFIIADGNEDKVVRIMKSLYRPYIWQKSYDKKMEKIKDKLKKYESKVK